MLVSLLLWIFTLVEWNCENLFDCQRDTLHDDTEWQPESFRHWNKYRYWQKLNHVGQTLLACGETNEGFRLPDLVVLCEVENDTVLTDLTRRSLLRNAGYEYLSTDSRDVRGMDVALLYSPFTFRPLHHHAIRVEPLGDMRPTRDILYVCGRQQGGDTLHVYALHAPSRYGGERQTRPHRMAVARRLLQSIDSLRAQQPNARIVVAGDFNDYSTSKTIGLLSHGSLINISQAAKGTHGAAGTYQYRGVWRSLDHILCSPSVAPSVQSCTVADFPFLLEDDEKYGGKKPRRNYFGAHWQNGFSDHLPLVARFAFS